MAILKSRISERILFIFCILLSCSSLCGAFQFGGIQKSGTFINVERNVRLHAASPSTIKEAPASSSALKKSKTSPPQLIQFIEPKTQTKVILIGTMHYNPTSIQMVKETVQDLAEKDSLGSVLVESCDIRWNTTMEILDTPRGKLFEPVLTSEMKAASDEAMKYGRPCVLGDQRINVTGASLGNTFKQTFVEVASPLNGGWGRLYSDFKDAAEVALPSGEGYLSAKSILDPRLLIAAPVSFAKYPLSFLARNPISTLIVFSIMGFITYLDSTRGGAVSFADASLQEQISSVLASIAFAGLEFGLFGRVMVQVLLAERNEIIAKNILDQCKIYSPSYNTKSEVGNFMDIFSVFSGKPSNEDGRVILSGDNAIDPSMYVPGSIQDNVSAKTDGDKAVVAVLGMAHCNGIVKLLKEQLVE